MAVAQRLGRSLMLPIATLPAAGLLLRFGQADMLGADGLGKHVEFMNKVADVLGAAGGAVFGNLPLIFAVGVAVGFAKKSDGSTGVAGLIGYLVFSETLKPMSKFVMGVDEAGAALKTVNYGVLGGILMGIIAALLWQKYYRVKLPDWLAFFGGRRFVPIITSGVAVVLAVVMSYIYPAFDWLVNQKLGGWLMNESNAVLGGFVFGTVNRLLIPFGLHHLINSIPWFTLGACTDKEGATLHGDLTCFFNGVDGTNAWSGSYMTGFFPIMMFALPAAAFAIWQTAKPERKKATGALMFSVALTAFLTGITEPLEYAFAYVAFPLYAVHAVLTGSALAVTNLLGAKDGFTFSAGAIDYLINFGKSAELSGGVFQGPIMIVLVGLAYAVIYFFVFRFMIPAFNFPTPGREDEGDGFEAAQAEAAVRTGKVAEEARKR
ncbi:PTS transporter subunit EIIC [Buchananella felis]|uniref:PTS transporter subunit EIIC n=1 Tax=Buchananella felis TaxID=3231492 RepID=UPI003527B4AA